MPTSVQINVAQAAPVITWSNPADIVYGASLGATQLNATADVPGTFLYTPPAGTVLGAGSGQTLSVAFTPTDATDYSGAIKTVQINVGQAAPVITWSNPADIVYGTALGATQLNATANVSGAFLYTPPAGTVLPMGSGQTLSVTFTPTDATDYSGAIKTVQINVRQAAPVITWSNPADIVYGTALGAGQLNATANVPGTFLYAPPAGTVLGAGSGQTLSVTFTPTDAKNYTTAAKSVQINVRQATPAITWANPADIVYGTALGPTQLNATANVPGAFAYTPPAGTVLPVGNGQTLSVAFTPTDAKDYTTATKSVQINVVPSSPARIVVYKSLSRNAKGQVVVSLTLTNSGSTDAQNARLTIGWIDLTPGTPLPQTLGRITAGQSVTATLTFPSTVGRKGAPALLTVYGTYNGGSFYSITGVTLP